jgi:hypothetical protein
MTGFLVRHKDGTHIAKCISDYILASGFPYRWTIHKSRAHAFEQMVAAALEEEPECSAEIIEDND